MTPPKVYPPNSNERVHFVYRALDVDGMCLYVGITNTPRTRHKAHLKHSAWISRVTKWVVTGPFTRSVAHDLERREILRLDPPHNQQWSLRSVPPATPGDEAQAIGRLVRIALIKAGRTQIEAATAIGLKHQAYMSSRLRGPKCFTSDELAALAGWLGTPVDRLICIEPAA